MPRGQLYDPILSTQEHHGKYRDTVYSIKFVLQEKSTQYTQLKHSIRNSAYENYQFVMFSSK